MKLKNVIPLVLAFLVAGTVSRAQAYLELPTSNIIANSQQIGLSWAVAPLIVGINPATLNYVLSDEVSGNNLSGSSGKSVYTISWKYTVKQSDRGNVLLLEVDQNAVTFATHGSAVISFRDLNLSAEQALALPNDVYELLANGTDKAYFDDLFHDDDGYVDLNAYLNYLFGAPPGSGDDPSGDVNDMGALGDGYQPPEDPPEEEQPPQEQPPQDPEQMADWSEC